jgi:hypothetical protein
MKGREEDVPLHIMRSVEEYAADFKARLVLLGCSEQYADAAYQDILRNGVQVKNSEEANAILSGRAHG